MLGLGGGCRNQAGGLIGSRLPVMDPADLLADVGMIIDIGVHTGTNQGVAEGGFMETGCAGCHHDPVDGAVFQIFHDQPLAGIRTHEHVGPRHGHTGQFFHPVTHRFHIDVVGYIAAAVADVDAYFPLLRMVRVAFLLVRHACVS